MDLFCSHWNKGSESPKHCGGEEIRKNLKHLHNFKFTCFTHTERQRMVILKSHPLQNLMSNFMQRVLFIFNKNVYLPLYLLLIYETRFGNYLFNKNQILIHTNKLIVFLELTSPYNTLWLYFHYNNSMADFFFSFFWLLTGEYQNKRTPIKHRTTSSKVPLLLKLSCVTQLVLTLLGVKWNRLLLPRRCSAVLDLRKLQWKCSKSKFC